MKLAVQFRPFALIFTFLIVFMLNGCGSSYRAPVDELGAPRFLDAGKTHRVNAGETLYVIAWMYDLDFSVLARVNNLREPYTIEPGQLLLVDLRSEQGAASRPAVATRGAASNGITVNPVQTDTGIRRSQLPGTTLQRSPLPESPTARTPEASAPVNPPAATREAPAVVQNTAPRATELPAEVTRTPTPSAPRVNPPAAGNTRETAKPVPAVEREVASTENADPIQWAWPARGNIVGRYTDAGLDNKGLDISGSRGDAVKAAADGEIVYAGSGLLRYGDLIIIKHNERFLSAYAHNDRLLVKEGAKVKRGDTIAELGSSGIDRTMLHFEIRMEGNPVDPLLYLPAQ